MCCRFFLETSPELRPYLEAAAASPLKGAMTARLGRPLILEGEVRPSDMVPVLATSRSSAPGVFPMVWGFSVQGRKSSLYNARSETAASKPTFRESWASRRCIIPASWYYEWEHTVSPSGNVRAGDKYRLQLKDGRAVYLAGLYRYEERNGSPVPVFTVLTREPGDGIRFLHNRMPVILPSDLIQAWIDPAGRPDEILSSALTDLQFEKASGPEPIRLS